MKRARRFSGRAALGIVSTALVLASMSGATASSAVGPNGPFDEQSAGSKPPTRLWYRVTLRYSGTERIVGTSASTKGTYESVYRRGVELHPYTAVLLSK